MGEILFLAHRIPFPPDRGDKIRSHHWLKALAGVAPVHVGTFAETARDRAEEGALAAYAASHCLVHRSRPLPLAGALAVARGQPVSLTAFASTRLKRWVRETLARRPIHAVFVFSGQMGQYVPADYQGRLIFDLCDVDSAKFEAYAEQGRAPWLYRREARLMGREEARLAGRADATLLISEAEAALFRSRLDADESATIQVVGNGIGAEFFDPEQVARHPLAESGGPHYVFTGQMDYPPNGAAAERFARSVLPALRQGTVGASFHIVGRAPTAAVRALGILPGVTVWGEVPDVRPFLAAADAVVAPLAIARGVQNKVLEAMAMARPVLLSPEAATGIPARDGVHYLVCRDDAEFVAKAHDLIDQPATAAAMGQAARAFVQERMSWDALYRRLGEIVLPGATSRHAV